MPEYVSSLTRILLHKDRIFDSFLHRKTRILTYYTRCQCRKDISKITKISGKHSMEKSINPLQLDKPPHLKKKQITIIRDLMARYQEPYDLSKKK